MVEWDAVSLAIEQRAILDQITLSIASGQCVALVGPSGAGKTSLLKCSASLCVPDEGEVRIAGQSLRTHDRLARQALRADLVYLPQLIPLVPNLPVVHNVLLGRVARWPRWKSLLSRIWPQDLDDVRAALKRVGLESRLWARPDELSGGEQQRVALARLLVAKPKLVLADEPAASLDVRNGCEAVSLLLNTGRDLGATVVVSLHDLELIGCGFDRVVAIDAGRVIWDDVASRFDRAAQDWVFSKPRASVHS